MLVNSLRGIEDIDDQINRCEEWMIAQAPTTGMVGVKSDGVDDIVDWTARVLLAILCDTYMLSVVVMEVSVTFSMVPKSASI